jgi:hypothetical protein
VRFEDGTPLVDVPLSLWGESEIVSRTDAEGRFHLHGDWMAERMLYVRKDGEYRLLLGAPVRMVADQRVEVDVTMERGMDVTSLVTDATTGAPIPGVEVVLRRPGQQEVQAVAAFADTDAEGHFRFEYLPRVLYTLALSHPGHQASQVKLDLATDPWPERLTLSPSRPFVVEIRGLPPEAAGEVVSWMLDRPDSFEVVEGGTTRRTGYQMSWDGKSEIDAQGRLTLDAPPAGRYHLTLFTSTWVPRTERDVEIPEGPVPPLVVTLPASARVSGVVVDSHERPLGDLGISIGSARTVRTDAAGRFESPSVPSGEQSVRLRTGEASVLIGSVVVPSAGALETRIAVAGSAAIEGQVLVGGTPVTSPGEAGLWLWDVATRRQVAEANVDAYGRFRIPFLTPGEYRLVAFGGYFLPEARLVQVAEGETRDVGPIRCVQPRFPVRLLFPPDVTIPPQVGVWAQDSSSPPGTVALPSQDVGGERWAVSVRVERDSDGKSWLLGLPPGSWRLRFTAEGFLPATVDLLVRPGDVPSLEVRLERR